VRQAAAHPREKQVEDRVLEHRAVSNLEDVPDVGFIAAGPRFLKRHVADAPGRLDQLLAADLGVGRPLLDVMVGKKCAERLLVDDLAAQQLAFGSGMMCRKVAIRHWP
jgi:hypothetical protein